MGIRKITAGLLGLAACTAAVAQGSFNFDDIPGVHQDPIVSVDVNPIIIGFVRSMLTAAGDPATAELLSGLRGIKLRVYHAAENSREFSSFIQGAGGRLEALGWQQVMSVQDEHSSVQWHLQMTEEAVSGMTVMVMDDTEAIFINIDGSINATDLGRIMAPFVNMPDVLGAMPEMPSPARPPAPASNGN
jgi:hypothetical protein